MRFFMWASTETRKHRAASTHIEMHIRTQRLIHMKKEIKETVSYTYTNSTDELDLVQSEGVRLRQHLTCHECKLACNIAGV